jgi:hypothetical protein
MESIIEWFDAAKVLPALDFGPRGESPHVLTCDKDGECRGISFCRIRETDSGHHVFWENLTDARCIVKWWAFLPGKQ